MTTGTVSRCRSCSAPILWTVTAATGKKMPMDEEPVAFGGQFVLEQRGRETIAHHVKSLAADGELLRGPRFQTHYATCPNAETWRRDRR